MPDISKLLLLSSLDAFKNYSDASGSVSVPSESYTDADYNLYTFDIPTQRNEVVSSQTRINFSFDSGKWYLLSNVINLDGEPNSNFSTQARADFVSNDTLRIYIYVVHQVPGTNSNPSFTVQANVYFFESPL